MILDRYRMDGKVAVITGAGRGIGAATAVGLAQAGADVVIAKRSAKFNSAFTKSGLTPDAGGTYFFPRVGYLAATARATSRTARHREIVRVRRRESGRRGPMQCPTPPRPIR